MTGRNARGEINWTSGIDDFQSRRAPDQRYRTAPLRGLFTHAKGGFYHDRRFAALKDVVDHYDTLWSLGLTDREKDDLAAFLNTLQVHQ